MGDIDGALKTANEIDDPWERAEALAGIATVQALSGDHRAAGETLDTALKTANQIDDAWYRARALASIAVAQAQSGDRRAAGETLDTALKASNEAGRPVRGIAVAQAWLGDIDGALKTAYEFSSGYGYRAEALLNIARALAAGASSSVSPGAGASPSVQLPAPILYWVDEAAQKIQRIIGEADAQTVQDLASSANRLVMPGSIALDPLAGRMYWTDDGDGDPETPDGAIRRANLDGSGPVPRRENRIGRSGRHRPGPQRRLSVLGRPGTGRNLSRQIGGYG